MKTLPLEMRQVTNPLPGSELVECFMWSLAPRWPGDSEKATPPETPGRVSCIYADSSTMVYDLAWGEAMTPGSIRATFRHPLP